jgi:hypothetical protein
VGGGGVWLFVSFRIFFSNNTRVRIFIFFVALPNVAEKNILILVEEKKII